MFCSKVPGPLLFQHGSAVPLQTLSEVGVGLATQRGIISEVKFEMHPIIMKPLKGSPASLWLLYPPSPLHEMGCVEGLSSYTCICFSSESVPAGAQPHLLSVPELCSCLAESWVTFRLYLQELLQYKRQNPAKVNVGHATPPCWRCSSCSQGLLR